MKRNALILALLVLPSLVLAADGQLRPVACPPGLSLDRRSLGAYDRQFIKPKETPGAVNPHAVVAVIRGAPLELAIALDSEKPGAKAPNLLRFDFTGTRQFAGTPTVPLKPGPRSEGGFRASFGPATIQVEHGRRTVPVSVQGSYSKRRSYRWLTLTLSTALEGRLAFGSKTYAVRVVDGNGNLALGDKAALMRSGTRIFGIQPGDTLAIDTGGGWADPKVVKAYYGEPVQVDGAWFDVALSPDRKAIHAKPSAAKFARLKIAHKKWSVKLAGAKHIVMLEGSNEPVTLPADTYTVVEFVETAASDAGIESRLASGQMDLYRGKAKTFEAPAGKTTELAVGSPLTASIATTVRKQAVLMDFKLTDAAGLSAQVVVAQPDKGLRQPKPGVEVLDALGESVHTGKFEYG